MPGGITRVVSSVRAQVRAAIKARLLYLVLVGNIETELSGCEVGPAPLV